MKILKIIAIISVLLCLVLSVFGCDKFGATKDPDPIQDVPPVAITAESIMSNFLNYEYVDKAPLRIDASLSETYGNVVSSNSPSLMVFCKETKDYMNKVTATYSVYSLTQKTVVATFTHEYEDEDYYRADDFDNQVLPPVEFYISVGELYNNVEYICVEKKTNTPIDEEIIEDNDLDYSYSHTYSIDFYDAEGTHITSTNTISYPKVISSNNIYLSASFGQTGAIFDIANNKLIKTYNADTESEYIRYDYTNERYNYILSAPYGNVDFGKPIGGSGRIEVYTKSGQLVCKYLHSDYAMISSSHVLANGDIMIQNLYSTNGTTYDFSVDGVNFDLQTLILDVETGKATEVEFDYFISNFLDSTQRKKMVEDSLLDGIKLTFNEQNVRNMALAVKVGNGQTNLSSTDYIFFDDLLTVNYILDKVIPEQDLSGEYRPLANDYFCVKVINEVADYAIVKNGKVVSYVPYGAEVTDYGVITEKAIYDLEMNMIYSLVPEITDDSETTYFSYPTVADYHYYGSFGPYAVYTTTDFEIQIGEDEFEYKDFVYVIDVRNGIETRYEESTVDNINENYLSIYNEREERYYVYNSDLETIISSNEAIYLWHYCDDTYVARISFNGKYYIYTLTDALGSDMEGGH